MVPNRACVSIGAALIALSLAACGSQLEPSTVADANAAVSGAQDGTGDQGDGTAPDDSGNGGDPGNDDGPGSNDANGPGDPGDPGDPDDPGAPNGPGDPTGGVKAGSCEGFKNQTGITDDAITIGNVADISGPIPGLLEPAQQAVRAYAEYFNSQGDICGRKLEVALFDSRFDAGAGQQAYLEACGKAFAVVGSMSGFDSGGAAETEDCGLPDIRVTHVTKERANCATCFAAYAISTNLVPTATAKFIASKHGDATEHVAVLYMNAGGAGDNAESQAAAYEEAGWGIEMVQGIDAAEFNYAPYVQAMKAEGVKGVVYFGIYQNTVKLQQAMEQQGMEADFFLQDPTVYDAEYVEQAGELGDGTYTFMAHDLFENTKNAEVQLYLSWLQQVKPGASPSTYGMWAWSAARLFVQKAIALGGKLTRPSLVSALNATTSWTGNGAHTASNPATNATPPCQKVAQLDGGTWRQVSPGSYMCDKVVNTGIGD